MKANFESLKPSDSVMGSSPEPGTCASSSSPVSNSLGHQAMEDDESENSSIN